MWPLSITINEIINRAPSCYLINKEMELFATVLNESSPIFTYIYPIIYMRGSITWLLDKVPKSRPFVSNALNVSYFRYE